MLIKAKTLHGYKLKAQDGEIGKVKEFYFDDRHYTIRYLVANTGSWLSDKQVLISPYALQSINKDKEIIYVNLTKKQIEDSPPLDTAIPISQQFENSYHSYYGWPMYYVGGPFMWGDYPYLLNDNLKWNVISKNKKSWVPHLRSTHDVSGSNIEAQDGDIGHIEDFIIDDNSWAIRYLIIDTTNWWAGKKVLVSPKWINRFSADSSKIFIKLFRETIKSSPEYKDDSLLNRQYEDKLHRHYNLDAYWNTEEVDHTNYSNHSKKNNEVLSEEDKNAFI